MSLRDEIFEQPAAIRATPRDAGPSRCAKLPPASASKTAHSFTSRRGAPRTTPGSTPSTFGVYHNGLPVALAAPSMFSVFKKPPKIGDALVVGISQSGQSPDIVSVIEEGRRQGALTLAITNDSDSPLAEAAELVIDTVAGPERAVAATKTYTTQLTAIAMLSVALTGDAEQTRVARTIPLPRRGRAQARRDRSRTPPPATAT